MTVRLLMGAFLLGAAACTAPGAPPAAEPAPAEAEVWACRDAVRDAAAHAYAMARYRDDQRAVMLFPAGPAMAQYEAETQRLRDEGARLLAALKTHDPEAEQAPTQPPSIPSLSEELVAAKIEAADACMASAGK
jgi:hypothetical protein